MTLKSPQPINITDTKDGILCLLCPAFLLKESLTKILMIFILIVLGCSVAELFSFPLRVGYDLQNITQNQT